MATGRELRIKRQRKRREQYGDDYVTGKVKGLQSKVLENQRAGRFGEITGAEVALRNTGDTIETLLSPIGDMVPDFIAEPVGAAVGAGMQYAAETPVGQEVVQYAQENPRMFDNLGAAANIGGVLPLARIAKTAINSGAARVPTMLEGFYGSGVGTPQKMLAAAKGAATAIPSTLSDALNPKAVAYERVTGVPLGKGRGEIGAGVTKGNQSMASAVTTDYISRQRGKGPAPFIAEGPIGKTNNLAEVPATDKAQVKKQLFRKGVNVNFSVPTVVANRAMNHIYDVWGIKPDKTEFVIKNPEGVQRLSKEARVGTAKGPKALRLLTQATADGDKGLEQFMRSKKKSIQDVTKEDLMAFYKDRGISVTSGGKKDPHVYIGTSHVSEAKELGGVNDFIAINPKTGDVYSVISDQHDMFGMDPVGGSSLMTVSPVQRSNFKASGNERYSMEDNLNARTNKGVGTSKSEGDRRPEVMQAAKRLEKMSGIPMNKGENPISYNTRVLKEFEAPAQAQDVATVARRSGMLAAAPQPFMSEEEQGGR
jgi:hypothetical protein